MSNAGTGERGSAIRWLLIASAEQPDRIVVPSPRAKCSTFGKNRCDFVRSATMRQLRFALELSKRHILAVVTITMLASPVWAYINGEHYDSLDADKQRLKMLGWTSAFEHYLSTSALPDKAALRRTANGLVGQALHHLPEEDAAKVSTETKQEIARIAREAFEQASMEVRQIIKTGQVGSLRYQVGALSWHRYSVTYDRDNHPRKKGQWGGLVPFVALRSTDRV